MAPGKDPTITGSEASTSLLLSLPHVTYLSAVAGNNYSAGKWEGRENAKEPGGPASGLPRSGERQRGHSRVRLAGSRASAGRGGGRPCRDKCQLFYGFGGEEGPSSCRWCEGCSCLCSEVWKPLCLLLKLSPLWECRITPQKAEGSSLSAMTAGLARRACRVPPDGRPSAALGEGDRRAPLPGSDGRCALTRLSLRAPTGRYLEIPV